MVVAQLGTLGRLDKEGQVVVAFLALLVDSRNGRRILEA